MDFEQIILSELDQAAKVLERFMNNPLNLQAINKASDIIVESFKEGGKVFSCGNGGSSCDAAHFAEELTGRFREDRKPLPAIAMNEIGHLTCVSNDYGYDAVFSRYLQALGNKGDVLLAISTSGNSTNILRVAECAKQKGIKVIALTGKSGGKLAEYADVEIRVAHNEYADRIQEIHIKIIHILIFLIEQKIIK